MRGLNRIVAAFALLVLATPGWSQAFSPLADFQSLSDAELQTMQVKLTFIGNQERRISTVLATAEGSASDVSLFEPFRRPGMSYANDLRQLRIFSASIAELRGILTGVAGVPEVSGGGAAAFPFISFALVATTAAGTIGFEAIVDPAGGQALHDTLLDAISLNREGRRLLAAFGCHAGVLETGSPTDVSGSVTIELRGVRLNRSTGNFVGTAAVTNDSATTLAAPVSLVLALPGNVHLINSDGFTCATAPEGREYVSLEAPIAPGATGELQLEFLNPEGKDIQVGSAQVLSGPGAR